MPGAGRQGYDRARQETWLRLAGDWMKFAQEADKRADSQSPFKG